MTDQRSRGHSSASKMTEEEILLSCVCACFCVCECVCVCVGAHILFFCDLVICVSDLVCEEISL